MSLQCFCPSSSKDHDNQEIPDDWKKGNVTLPFKKGKKRGAIGQVNFSLWEARGAKALLGM